MEENGRKQKSIEENERGVYDSHMNGSKPLSLRDLGQKIERSYSTVYRWVEHGCCRRRDGKRIKLRMLWVSNRMHTTLDWYESWIEECNK